MNRVKREKNQEYTTISNIFLRDKTLSLKSKGFLAIVMGLPDDWDFSIAGICFVVKEGKTAIYNIIKELKEKGYCETFPIRNEKGQLMGNDYSFSETKSLKPNVGSPYTEKPKTDSKRQLNTYINNNLNKTITNQINPIAPKVAMTESKENIYKNQKKEKEKSCGKKENEYSDSFNAFWKLYDKRVGDKKKVAKKWDKLSQKNKDAVMAYLPKYKEAQPDKKFRKNPETFLNNKSWNDELIYSNAPASKNDNFKEIDKDAVSDTSHDTF